MPNPFYTYIRYIWFGSVWFYGISTMVGFLMPTSFCAYILDIYDWVWFDLVLWNINHCWSFKAKPSLYMYIKYIGFVLVTSYGISTIVGYLMPNPFYRYIKYTISRHFDDKISKRARVNFFLHIIKWFHLFLFNTNKSIDHIYQPLRSGRIWHKSFTVNHLFAKSLKFSSIFIKYNICNRLS